MLNKDFTYRTRLHMQNKIWKKKIRHVLRIDKRKIFIESPKYILRKLHQHYVG
jgi:hypothetical protein